MCSILIFLLLPRGRQNQIYFLLRKCVFLTFCTLCIDVLWIHQFVQGFKVSIAIVVFIARADFVFSHILSCTRGWENVSQIVCLSLVVVCSCSLCFRISVISAPLYHGVSHFVLPYNQHLEILIFNFQVAGSQTLKESGKPVKVAESDVDVSTSLISSYSVH